MTARSDGSNSIAAFEPTQSCKLTLRILGRNKQFACVSCRHKSPEQNATTERLEKLESIIMEICKVSASPGVSLGVLHGGEVIHLANFGYLNIESKKAPDPNTIYSINSMTKALTAIAFGILIEDGKFQWDTPVYTVLDGFGRGHGKIGEIITVTDHLSHRTGIISPDTFFFQDHNVLLLKKHEAIKTFDYANQKQVFRDSYLYNNFAYTVTVEWHPS